MRTIAIEEAGPGRSYLQRMRFVVVPDITPREMDVLGRICMGDERNEIARQLHLSPVTVRHVTDRLLQKFNARNRTQLAVLAVRCGIVQTCISEDLRITLK